MVARGRQPRHVPRAMPRNWLAAIEKLLRDMWRQALFSLIAEFKSSAEFTGKRPATRRGYLRHQSMIEREFGKMPLEVFSDPEVRGVQRMERSAIR
jgi:hypothetical protein